MTARPSVLLEAGKRLLLVAPAAVMILALTQKWYLAENDLGFVIRTRYPLTPDLPKVTLAACIAYIAFTALFGLRWRWATVLLSLALSVVALATLVEGRGQIDLSAQGDWYATSWYMVGWRAGVWVIVSLALMFVPAIAAHLSTAARTEPPLPAGCLFHVIVVVDPTADLVVRPVFASSALEARRRYQQTMSREEAIVRIEST